MKALGSRVRAVLISTACGIALSGCRAASPTKPADRQAESTQPSKPEQDMAIPEITPAEAKKLLDENNDYVYLDVRSVAEFVAGHAPGAMNIPIAEPNPATGQMEPNPDFLSVVEATIPRDAKLIVGCKSGGRSARAAAMLFQTGYANVHNMVGGFGGAVGPDGMVVTKGWSMLGYPVERGEAGERSYKSISVKVRK